MARQKLTYKLYPVSTRVDPRGVYYGLIQGPTTEPETSLREILAYKKVTAFDPAQVLRLVDDVIQGGMELTALDGRPRAISSLLKTYLGFDESFPSADARVTTQKLLSKVRLLKDLRVAVNMDDFTLVNEAADSTIKITSAQVWKAGDPAPTQAGSVFDPALFTTASEDNNPKKIQIVGLNLDRIRTLQFSVLDTGSEAVAIAFYNVDYATQTMPSTDTSGNMGTVSAASINYYNISATTGNGLTFVEDATDLSAMRISAYDIAYSEFPEDSDPEPSATIILTPTE